MDPETKKASPFFNHRWLHRLVFVLPQLTQYWFWIGISVVLTFLYSAPKIPADFAYFLKRIAIGKTIFLALVWTYVTSTLPILLADERWQISHVLFCLGRFFYIYAICIIFDYRDREQDRLEGIKSMITYFNETAINVLFYACMIIYFLLTAALVFYGFSVTLIIILLLPAVIVAGLFSYLKKNFSDYLYYFFLDGMMAFSALLTAFLHFN